MGEGADGITVTVRMFGALRDHGESVTLRVPRGATAASVKAALGRAVPADPALIARSVIATDHEVLADDAALEGDAPLAILPPVCGG